MSLNRAAPLIPDRAPRRPNNLRGLLLMAAAFFVFAAADTQAKFLTEWFHPMQIVWTRQLGLLTGALVLLILNGPSILKTRRPGLQVLRGMLAVVSAAGVGGYSHCPVDGLYVSPSAHVGGTMHVLAGLLHTLTWLLHIDSIILNDLPNSQLPPGTPSASVTYLSQYLVYVDNTCVAKSSIVLVTEQLLRY